MLALVLLTFGLLMVYSASSMLSLVRFDNGHAFLVSQAIKGAVGVLAMVVVARVDYRLWARFAPLLLCGSLALLALTILPGTGGFVPVVNGARRWIGFPGFTFQPAELVKFALVVWMAAALARRRDSLGEFWSGAVLLCLPACVAVGMLVLQPDFGSALFVVMLAAVLLFLGGVRWGHLALLAGASVPVLVALAVAEPYRMRRLLAFRDPEKYLDSLSYQVHQSLVSLGSGGLLGVGIGSSKQKFFFLPEAHTDFIFAIVGEELGFVGAGLTLAAFLYLAYVGFGAARSARDSFGLLLGGGLTAMLALGALFNIAVATGNLPATGLTLPFISYGASSLTISLVAIGTLMNLSRPRSAGDRVLRSAGGPAVHRRRPLLPRGVRAAARVSGSPPREGR